ncbi:hypothetical protein N7516_009033 [Penicillium verrucosum]|uniref:uncharacterized protein n=1 Tax=Penicillium verrucosum TaxID=60171 RepID=UPI0025459FDA|nr:uncharacterized protein N7516_009033 [Penicillium verrucosum]KAJ5927260.1 hypothetical protein N7516_009033 [Penicillium verrucosum]
MYSTLPDASKVGLPASDATSAAELASLKVRLRAALVSPGELSLPSSKTGVNILENQNDAIWASVLQEIFE